MLINTSRSPLPQTASNGATRVLVIEDNPATTAPVRLMLGQHGFAVDASRSGFEGEDLAASGEYELILLDLLPPDRDGADVCRNLRRRGVGAKVLILTAVSSTGEKIKGLDSGADDYVTKPFDFEELLARIRALLRRGDITACRFLRCDDLVLDLYTQRARRGLEAIDLSKRECAVLEFLMRNQDCVVSRAQIWQHVWGMAAEPSDNTVNVYMSLLRKKVDQRRGLELIHTLRGAGYRFGIADQPHNGAMNGVHANGAAEESDAAFGVSAPVGALVQER